MTPKDDERVDLRVDPADLKRWRATAGVEGVPLSEWIRRRCNEVAVDQELIDVVAKKMAERNEATKRPPPLGLATIRLETPNPNSAAKRHPRDPLLVIEVPNPNVASRKKQTAEQARRAASVRTLKANTREDDQE